jgi:RNA polymerase sigma factor (sigma-70 family)
MRLQSHRAQSFLHTRDPRGRLDPNEQQTLLARTRDGDQEARHELVLRNLGLVGQIVGRMKLDPWLCEEAFQEGIDGLITAIDRYDPDLGATLSTYAHYWIRQRIGVFFRDRAATIRLPGHLACRDPDDPEKARHVARIREGCRPLDGREGTGRGGAPVPMEVLAADMPPVGFELERADLARHVLDLLDALPSLQRRILQARFGLDAADGRTRTLRDLGRELGISQEWVRHQERTALATLRRRLAAADDAEKGEVARARQD